MSVLVVGLNHRTVPLDFLERVAVGDTEIPKALHDLRGRSNLSEAVVLSTCMRTEIYAVVGRFHGAMADLRDFFAEWSGSPPETLGDYLYSYYDDAAGAHLFKVASGIDSAVLGEGEILGQIRSAWQLAREEDATGPVLDRLFRHAVEVGKRARSETAIARGTTSLSQAAVALAEARLGGLRDRRILIVGAGDMGHGMARTLASVEGVSEVVIANRTPARAADLASAIGGRPVPLRAVPDELVAVDVLLSSTDSAGVVFGVDELSPVVARRDGRPLLVIDVAVPRDIDPAVAGLPGVTLLDMDDLKAFAEVGVAERRREVTKVLAIVDDEVGRYADETSRRQLDPLVSALRSQAEAIRTAELERYRVRLAGLDDRQREAVDGLTRAILAKVLHEPTVQLKDAAGTGRGEALAEALRALFAL